MHQSIPKMKDVAKLAGVSIKTVSRVVNNEPHVTEGLREKVKAAVDQLGFVPSPNARGLRSHRGYTVHYIIHNNRSNYVNAIQAGTIQACQEQGYQLVVSMIDDSDSLSDAEITEQMNRLPILGTPVGAILVSPLTNNKRIVSALKSMGIAIARIGSHDFDDDELEVKINDREAAKDITNYLLQLGHRRIGFVRGKENQKATVERFQGYQDALNEAGLTVDDTLIQAGNFEFESGLKAGDSLLKRSDPPSAIFASNDDMAAGVLSAAHRLRIAVPDQLSVVGFDDSELAEKMWPALTTIRQPLLELGSVATKMLIANAQNNQDINPRQFLPYELIIRESTGPVPAL